MAEFRADWSTAVKTYQTAYSQVQKVPLGTTLPLQHWFELTSVAEQMHIKVGCCPDCNATALGCIQTPRSPVRQMLSLVCYHMYEAALGNMFPRSGHCMGLVVLVCCPVLFCQGVGTAQDADMVPGANSVTFAQVNWSKLLHFLYKLPKCGFPRNL